RAWTYQAAIFLFRRSFFTDQQICFEWDSICCRESLDTCSGRLQKKRDVEEYSGKALSQGIGNSLRMSAPEWVTINSKLIT
ncbi:hypothetical protein K432DRAFT_296303, partial [Lepidopterella palustris CBS 459.81]